MSDGHPLTRPASRPMVAPGVRSRTLPKAPVLGWGALQPGRGYRPPTVGDLPERVYTTSGRAALLGALRQRDWPAGSTVLAPSYHCPTMVAPILQAGLSPQYFALGADGLPRLDGLGADQVRNAKAMIVAHYFGLPNGLQPVLDWCRERDIVLIEDCAHSYFGQAGERPVGRWGDYATASLSKFFPVAEAGLLASAQHALRPFGLEPPGFAAQVKGVVDILEFAHGHHRLDGLAHLLSPLFWLKNRRRGAAAAAPGEASAAPADAQAMMLNCDMARAVQRPTLAAIGVHRLLPMHRIVRRRQDNYRAYAAGLAGAPGAHGLFERAVDDAAPYVFPLWVDGRQRADAVYASVRAARLPIFRWDRVWPGAPSDPQDVGVVWRHQVLQLLCHQSLDDGDIAFVIDTLRQILQTH